MRENFCIRLRTSSSSAPDRDLGKKIKTNTAFHLPFWLSHILVNLFYDLASVPARTEV